MASSILTSFLGALQASLAVLLTISYGVIASRFNILKASSARDISKICVRLFLPALLITNIGQELHLDTAYRYVPVLSSLPFTDRYLLLILPSMGAHIHSELNVAWLGSSSRLSENFKVSFSCLDYASDMLQQYYSPASSSYSVS